LKYDASGLPLTRAARSPVYSTFHCSRSIHFTQKQSRARLAGLLHAVYD
jgi:hypothetical protein